MKLMDMKMFIVVIYVEYITMVKLKKILYNLLLYSIVFFSVLTLLHIIVHPISLKSYPLNIVQPLYSNWEMQNSFTVNHIVESCKYYDDYTTVACVVNLLGLKYNYTARNDFIYLNVDQFVNEGYMCRDIAIAYDAVFRKLGYQTNYIFRDDHVYNHIWNIEGMD